MLLADFCEASLQSTSHVFGQHCVMCTDRYSVPGGQSETIPHAERKSEAPLPCLACVSVQIGERASCTQTRPATS